MTTEEINKEAKNVFLTIMQKKWKFSSDIQWNYYLTEIANRIMWEVNTNLWKESSNEEERK